LNKESYNFFQIKETADARHINHFLLLEKAFKLNMLDVEENEKNLLLQFIYSSKEKGKFTKSQLYQDIFADFVVSERHEKTFLEFGATDGLNLSNTFMLENKSKWNGVLAEPDSLWHNQLKNNRPETRIITDCIWKSTGDIVNFLSSDVSELSTIESFKYSDQESMPGNSALRNKKTKKIKIKTISLNDVIKNEFKEIAPSYISIDTEGSEYEILKGFDFIRYKPIVFTIEHNYTNNQKKIDELMTKNNYVRVFRKITTFDAWYILKESLIKLPK